VLHEEQWAWLRTELTNSTASAHLILSSVQVLTSAAAVESWGHFPRERRRLLSLLEETRPRGALLLSGDVHYAELAGAPRASLPPGAELLEVTSSGLTHACGLGAVGGPLCGLQHRLFASHRLPTPHDARRPLPPLPPSAVAALRALGGPAAGAYPFLNFGSAELRWPPDPYQDREKKHKPASHTPLCIPRPSDPATICERRPSSPSVSPSLPISRDRLAASRRLLLGPPRAAAPSSFGSTRSTAARRSSTLCRSG